jgi:hypothetical protein
MEETDSSTSAVKVQFKSIRKRPQRRRSRGDSDEEGEVEYNKEKYEETRELQKLRFAQLSTGTANSSPYSTLYSTCVCM